MWKTVFSLAVSVVTTAATAGWLTTATGRRISRLAAHAELATKLPDGPARRLLEVQVQRDVLDHMATLRTAKALRWMRVSDVVTAVAGLCSIAVVALAILLFIDEGNRERTARDLIGATSMALVCLALFGIHKFAVARVRAEIAKAKASLPSVDEVV